MFAPPTAIYNHPSWFKQKWTLYVIKQYNYFCLLNINPTTTNVVSSNPVHGEMYSIQHYVIKFVSDLPQVGGFLRVLLFPPPAKLTASI